MCLLCVDVVLRCRRSLFVVGCWLLWFVVRCLCFVVVCLLLLVARLIVVVRVHRFVSGVCCRCCSLFGMCC